MPGATMCFPHAFDPQSMACGSLGLQGTQFESQWYKDFNLWYKQQEVTVVNWHHIDNIKFTWTEGLVFLFLPGQCDLEDVVSSYEWG